MAESTTVTFQCGPFYSGTKDTYISRGAPDEVHGGEDYFKWDLSPSNIRYGLLRFDNIVGDSAFKIPQAVTVLSAELTLDVGDPSVAPAGMILTLLQAWDESSTTWNTFVGEYEQPEPGTHFDLFDGDAPIAEGPHHVDVTETLQVWVNDPGSNLGWIFIPKSSDGTSTHTCDEETLSERPMLTVTFLQ